MFKIAVLASGNGTNFENLVNYYADNQYVEITCLIVDKIDCGAVKKANRLNIPVFTIEFKKIEGKSNSKKIHEDKVLAILRALDVELVCLAGYMRILSSGFINQCVPILNIHPSYLPEYPGINSYKRAYEDNVLYSGVTVHFVNEIIDGGEIVVQEKFSNHDLTFEEFEALGRKLEYKLFPRGINKVIEQINKKKLKRHCHEGSNRSFFQRSIQI